MTESLTYADAGVNIDKANKLIGKIKDIARRTPRHGVMGEIGGFGGLFSLNLANVERPVLVSATDGVGTKLKIAFLAGKHDTVGIDLVAMCVNDIAVQGARPLFFLDYLSMGALDDRVATEVIKGVGEGCNRANCALIGGETAEMPGFYGNGEYDLAGFSVGLVDNDKIVDGSDIRVGDRLVAIGSSGLHSNGFSLVRAVCFDRLGLTVDSHVPELGRTLGEELLTPTKIYSETVQKLLRDLPVRGLAHITGGGLPENLIRVVPQSCDALVRRNSWSIPAVFRFLQDAGKISETEMFRAFNCGVGMAVVTPQTHASEVEARLRAMNEDAAIIGEIAARKGSDSRVRWID
jgi:phosphoribosylformylglycinamidine cyclo-ligase